MQICPSFSSCNTLTSLLLIGIFNVHALNVKPSWYLLKSLAKLLISLKFHFLIWKFTVTGLHINSCLFQQTLLGGGGGRCMASHLVELKYGECSAFHSLGLSSNPSIIVIMLIMLTVCNFCKHHSGHVMAEMRRVFNIPEEVETRVWTKYMSNTYDLLSNLEYTVQDAGLYHGQV